MKNRKGDVHGSLENENGGFEERLKMMEVFSSVVSSRAVVLLDFVSNVLYKRISKYGKLGFQSFGVVLAVLE